MVTFPFILSEIAFTRSSVLNLMSCISQTIHSLIKGDISLIIDEKSFSETQENIALNFLLL